MTRAEILTQRYFRSHEVADILKIHVKTLHRWHRAGRLTGRRVGKKLLFAEADVARLLEHGQEGSAHVA
jgi:excisionase family DNA binding protein